MAALETLLNRFCTRPRFVNSSLTFGDAKPAIGPPSGKGLELLGGGAGGVAPERS